MRTRRGTGRRDAWWEQRLAQADTAKDRMAALYGKLLADIARLPEEEQEMACEVAAKLLEEAVGEIQVYRAEERLSA